MMDLQLSPHYYEGNFKWPLSLDDKLTIFEDQIRGWSLDIADQMVNGITGPDGEFVFIPIPQSHFAALSIVLSYFEMIGIFKLGINGSKKAFKAGVGDIFRQPSSTLSPMFEDIATILYKQARCGLYHVGQTGEQFVVGLFVEGILEFYPDSPYNFKDSNNTKALKLSVPSLIKMLKNHFELYIKDLRDSGNNDLRKRFEKSFDEAHPQFLNRQDPPPYIDISPLEI